ncbi:MAG: hypothetical protein ACQKBT_06845 [Puniceicoccales bacterium]
MKSLGQNQNRKRCIPIQLESYENQIESLPNFASDHNFVDIAKIQLQAISPFGNQRKHTLIVSIGNKLVRIFRMGTGIIEKAGILQGTSLPLIKMLKRTGTFHNKKPIGG